MKHLKENELIDMMPTQGERPVPAPETLWAVTINNELTGDEQTIWFESEAEGQDFIDFMTGEGE